MQLIEQLRDEHLPAKLLLAAGAQLLVSSAANG